MQVHPPPAHVTDGEFPVRLNPGGGKPFAIIAFHPDADAAELFMETPGDCDRLIRAAILAKKALLLHEATGDDELTGTDS